MLIISPSFLPLIFFLFHRNDVLIQGTHDELLANGGKYAEMWNMQLHSTRTNYKGSTTSLTGMDADDIASDEK